MNQKVTQQGFLSVLWHLHTKKVDIWSFIMPRSGASPKIPDPDPTKKVWIQLDPDPNLDLLHWLQLLCNFVNVCNLFRQEKGFSPSAQIIKKLN
jgi:hypothetical protein